MPPTFTTEGIDAAKAIRAAHPGIGVVVLSQYVEEDYAFELLQDGVLGSAAVRHGPPVLQCPVLGTDEVALVGQRSRHLRIARALQWRSARY